MHRYAFINRATIFGLVAGFPNDSFNPFQSILFEYTTHSYLCILVDSIEMNDDEKKAQESIRKGMKFTELKLIELKFPYMIIKAK